MRLILPALLAASALVGQQRLEITIEKREANAWKVMDPGHVFVNGDQVRFRFRSSQPGFLYVVNEGTSGEQVTLFPNEQTGEDNKVEAGKEYAIPGNSGAFRVTGPGGYDNVYWVLSPVRIGAPAVQQYKPLPAPPKPGAVPPNLSPRCDDTILRARGECVDSSGAGLKQNTPPGMQARELFFVQKGNQSVVSVPPAPPVAQAAKAAPITYLFKIAHK
ncbi:MAG: DUF4384 domain-containing protein [Acidobacteria bacterium]|nr:DUF4384 domain-containing protein [Acidobacteriota bacterium]